MIQILFNMTATPKIFKLQIDAVDNTYIFSRTIWKKCKKGNYGHFKFCMNYFVLNLFVNCRLHFYFNENKTWWRYVTPLNILRDSQLTVSIWVILCKVVLLISWNIS